MADPTVELLMSFEVWATAGLTVVAAATRGQVAPRGLCGSRLNRKKVTKH